MASPVVASQLAHRDPSQHFAYQKKRRERKTIEKREKKLSLHFILGSNELQGRTRCA